MGSYCPRLPVLFWQCYLILIYQSSLLFHEKRIPAVSKHVIAISSRHSTQEFKTEINNYILAWNLICREYQLVFQTFIGQSDISSSCFIRTQQWGWLWEKSYNIGFCLSQKCPPSVGAKVEQTLRNRCLVFQHWICHQLVV